MAAIRPLDARAGVLLARTGERKPARSFFLKSFRYPLFPSPLAGLMRADRTAADAPCRHAIRCMAAIASRNDVTASGARDRHLSHDALPSQHDSRHLRRMSLAKQPQHVRGVLMTSTWHAPAGRRTSLTLGRAHSVPWGGHRL
jgi:hypothetical protein